MLQILTNIEEWLNLQTTFKSTYMCYQCRVAKDDFMVAPSRVSTSYRHDVATFRNECLRPGPKSSYDRIQ